MKKFFDIYLWDTEPRKYIWVLYKAAQHYSACSRQSVEMLALQNKYIFYLFFPSFYTSITIISLFGSITS